MTTTRQRLIAAAIELFAQQGYARTSVGQIEATAGLTPRAGGFYKHFSSKAAVVDVALEERTERVDQVIAALGDAPLGDRRAELRLLARVAMHELDAERDLLRVAMKEGDQFPALRDEFYERFPRRGYAAARQWLERTLDARGIEVPDRDSTAALLMGGIVHLHLMETVFDRPPPDTDRERFLDAWVEGSLAMLDGLEAAHEKEAAA